MSQGFRDHLAQSFPLQMGRPSPREADRANCSGLLRDRMTKRDSNPGRLITRRAGTPGPFLIACEPRRVFPFLTHRGKKKKKNEKEKNTTRRVKIKWHLSVHKVKVLPGHRLSSISMRLSCKGRAERYQRPRGPQSLKHVLSDPLQKEPADPCTNTSYAALLLKTK